MATAGSGFIGGVLELVSGQGTSGAGGAILLIAGDGASGAGGAVNISGGSTPAENGGSVTLTAGSGAGEANGIGGTLTLRGGVGAVENGGSLVLKSGATSSADASSITGSISITTRGSGEPRCERRCSNSNRKCTGWIKWERGAADGLRTVWPWRRHHSTCRLGRFGSRWEREHCRGQYHFSR